MIVSQDRDLYNILKSTLDVRPCWIFGREPDVRPNGVQPAVYDEIYCLRLSRSDVELLLNALRFYYRWRWWLLNLRDSGRRRFNQLHMAVRRRM